MGSPRELPIDTRIRIQVGPRPLTWTGDSRDIIYAAGWGPSGSRLWRVSADGSRLPP